MVGAVFDWVVLGMAGMFRFDLARSVDARLVKAGGVLLVKVLLVEVRQGELRFGRCGAVRCYMVGLCNVWWGMLRLGR